MLAPEARAVFRQLLDAIAHGILGEAMKAATGWISIILKILDRIERYQTALDQADGWAALLLPHFTPERLAACPILVPLYILLKLLRLLAILYKIAFSIPKFLLLYPIKLILEWPLKCMMVLFDYLDTILATLFKCPDETGFSSCSTRIHNGRVWEKFVPYKAEPAVLAGAIIVGDSDTYTVMDPVTGQPIVYTIPGIPDDLGLETLPVLQPPRLLPSGGPVVTPVDPLPENASAVIRSAWVHMDDRHALTVAWTTSPQNAPVSVTMRDSTGRIVGGPMVISGDSLTLRVDELGVNPYTVTLEAVGEVNAPVRLTVGFNQERVNWSA